MRTADRFMNTKFGNEAKIASMNQARDNAFG